MGGRACLKQDIGANLQSIGGDRVDVVIIVGWTRWIGDERCRDKSSCRAIKIAIDDSSLEPHQAL
jgi:hypothetical protein